jgi:meso-butanediol dehydrogenase/(S,S)-butanediol dehydrogenase/diacetyl reductase
VRGGRLEGKVVLVTGAGQGIGEGIARAASAEGASVSLVGRTLSKLEKVRESLEAAGRTAIAIQCDVRLRDEVDRAVSATLEELGRIDGLVNCAQSVALGPVAEMDEAGLRMTWESGFLGTLWFMQACLKSLSAANGSVVNLGTGAALRPDPAGFAAYAGTKEMVRTLTRAAAVEWGPLGVRVNALIPNGMSPGLELWSRVAPDQYREFVASIPLGRVGDLENDVGRAAVFLLSDDARYVTGQTLMADGGQAYLR